MYIAILGRCFEDAANLHKTDPECLFLHETAPLIWTMYAYTIAFDVSTLRPELPYD